jgi:hypothetical protein
VVRLKRPISTAAKVRFEKSRGAEIKSSSATQLTYFHGKLHLANTDRNGGLQAIASV